MDGLQQNYYILFVYLGPVNTMEVGDPRYVTPLGRVTHLSMYIVISHYNLIMFTWLVGWPYERLYEQPGYPT